MIRHLLVALVALGAMIVSPAIASAQSASCTIRSVQALKAKAPFDARLNLLKHQLKKPPFSAFGSFKLLAVAHLKLPHDKTVQAKLPNKKVIRLTFVEKLLVAKKVRLRMRYKITAPRALGLLGGTVYKINNGGTLLHAGERFAGGTLIVAITCSSK